MSLLRSLHARHLAGFFSGIGRTRVIMTANFAALLVNLFLNYVLIFGKWGFPRLGIAGAAAGRVVSAAVTITFNWNLLPFMPMVGVGIAVTSLVGQNLGRRNTAGAERGGRWKGRHLAEDGAYLPAEPAIPETTGTT
ncbi:MAG: MATE family efflux transporter [Lentisphaeria bacterium]|jgi:Na+-driven multidrug efflux pump